MAGDPVYDEVAAFLAALAGGGVRHIVLSPGSRSTPLTVCAAAQPALTHWMQLDERTAGFFALGLAKATRSPVALVCTSGTAAANYFPAVIEASRTGVPLLVLSADRPPELRGGWGANQTIDQIDLFGRYVRLFLELPVGGESAPDNAVAAAQQVLAAAGGPAVGPVQVNWPFRKPLEPVDTVPVIDPVTPSDVSPNPAAGDFATVAARIAGQRGVVVVGPLDDPAWTDALDTFATASEWPVIAEATSQLRLGTPADNLITYGDRIVSNAVLGERLAPEVVVFAGATPTCPAYVTWAAGHGAETVLLVDPAAPWNDAGPVDATVIKTVPSGVIAADAPTDPGWLADWQALDAHVGAGIEPIDRTTSGPAIARTVAAALAHNDQLLVANSMAVRDLDRYTAARSGLRVHVSRGASGIDGQIATAAGIAAAAIGHTTLLIGDIAFLHDLSSVLAAVRSGVDLTIVVMNDDGGGIFSMLPIARMGDAVQFDELFHTPHGTDLAALGAFDGVEFARVASAEELVSQLGLPGVRVVEVLIDPQANLANRQAIDQLVESIANR